jgi:hypothetical protein
MTRPYLCSVCGQNHDGVPLSWGPNAPDMWAALPPEGREERGEVGSDQCVIDEKHFFIRGRIEIPVLDTGELFAWLVWAEVSARNFLSMFDMWTVEGRETTAPYEGRLANNLTLYADSTLGLHVKLHTRPVGQRPFIEVVEDHPLFREQRDGVSHHQVQAISHRLQSDQ